jgi:hypothetical protein
MSTLFSGVHNWQLRPYSPSVAAHEGKQRRLPFMVRLSGLLACFLGLIIFGVVAPARLRPLAPIEPPADLRPGNLLPADVNCLLPDDRYNSCTVRRDGKTVELLYDARTRQILRVEVPGAAYRFGDLILAWGVPTGYARSWYGCSVVVYWQTRAAYLYTCVLALTSQVMNVEFGLVVPPSSTWH